jgi:hypothetical protein
MTVPGYQVGALAGRVELPRHPERLPVFLQIFSRKEWPTTPARST